MNSKRKGSGGERELLDILREYDKDAKRNDQTYIGGKDNPDISFSLNGVNYHIECKRTERLRLHEAIQQAERDAGKEKTPLVAHRRNREQWYATMKLKDLLTALKGGGKI